MSELGYAVSVLGIVVLGCVLLPTSATWDSSTPDSRAPSTRAAGPVLSANAGPDQVVKAGRMVTFNGTGSMGDVVNYSWSFEYGGHQVELYGESPTFRFDTPGIYPVTLNVWDGTEAIHPYQDFSPQALLDNGIGIGNNRFGDGDWAPFNGRLDELKVYNASFESLSGTNLIAYWDFNEGRGLTLNDVSGRGNDGVLRGAPGWVQGYEGSALSFYNDSRVERVPDTMDDPIYDEFTVTAWVFWEGFHNWTPSVASYIIDARDLEGSHGGFILMLNEFGRLECFMDYEYPAQYQSLQGKTQVPVGVWTRVAVSFDYPRQRWVLYLDGEEDARLEPGEHRDTDTMLVTVHPNQDPLITGEDVVDAHVGVQYISRYTADDPDDGMYLEPEVLTWSASTNATWLDMNESTGVLSGVPARADVGWYRVEVVVHDGDGGTDSTGFTLVVDIEYNIISVRDPEILADTMVEGAGSVSLTRTGNPSGDRSDGTIGIYGRLDFEGTGTIIWSNISMYYTESSLAPGMKEEDLRIFWWDDSRSAWVLAGASRVDTRDDMVWANVTHFSIFAIRSQAIDAPRPGGQWEPGLLPVLLIGMLLAFTISGLAYRSEPLLFALSAMAVLGGPGAERNSLELRGVILGIVRARPGVHYRWIRMQSGASNGSCAYHLRRLEKDGLITSRKDGVFKRFYPRGMARLPDYESVGPRSLTWKILDVLREHPGASQTEIGYLLDEPRNKIHYHISNLRKKDMVALRRDECGRLGCYLVDEEDTPS